MPAGCPIGFECKVGLVALKQREKNTGKKLGRISRGRAAKSSAGSPNFVGPTETQPSVSDIARTRSGRY